MVVFVGDSVFKTPMSDNVVYAGGYIRFIKSKIEPILAGSEVQGICNKIESGRLKPSIKTHINHVQHVKEIVEKNISGAIRGLQTNGVMGCAKHFPGHGTTVKDSHYDLPHLTKKIKELEEFEIDPFIKAAKARVNFIMVAHMVVDVFDSDLPCSLAPKCYEYIRKNLKYSRPIITDDLSMKAITSKMSIEDASVLALNAGADILLFQNIEEAKSTFARVSDAIKVKEILKVKIDEKLKRVESTKKEYFTDFKPVYIPSIKDQVKTKQIAAFLKDIKVKISE